MSARERGNGRSRRPLVGPALAAAMVGLLALFATAFVPSETFPPDGSSSAGVLRPDPNAGAVLALTIATGVLSLLAGLALWRGRARIGIALLVLATVTSVFSAGTVLATTFLLLLLFWTAFVVRRARAV